VLTANHVVAQVSSAQVTTRDGRKFDAKLVGRDPATDIAVLQLQGQTGKLKAIPSGDSDKIEVGDFVIAIGNPFGLGQTVTSGIVSALGRTGLGKQGYEDFIQTDASINPGNSGGALVNLRGQLIGINTAIISPGGGNVGIGFAVPINMARRVMEQLVQYGEVRRGQIGISIRDLGAELAAKESYQGALIAEIASGSPAEKAGLQKGDIVKAADGTPIRSASQLRNLIGLTPPRWPRRASVRTQWRCSQRQRRGGSRKSAGETHGRSMIRMYRARASLSGSARREPECIREG
jgi:serine protease Do